MSETIADIVRDMRAEHTNAEPSCWVMRESEYNKLLDIINAAFMSLEHKMNDLCNENARLRAALKPVLECFVERKRSELDEDGLICSHTIIERNKFYCVEAVCKAQHIYKQSEVK